MTKQDINSSGWERKKICGFSGFDGKRSLHGHTDRDAPPVPQAAKNQPHLKSSFIKASPNLPLFQERGWFWGQQRHLLFGWVLRVVQGELLWGMIVKRKCFVFLKE